MPRCLPALAGACCALVLAACQPSPPAQTPADAPTANPAAEPAAAAPATYWQCGDTRITARFDNAADNVALDIDGRALTLPQAVSASGARYADAAGNEFWNKGREAGLTLVGQPRVECTQVEEASPWDQAKARGAIFRALGTEPGWTAEVGGGQAPALTAELDYGERTLTVEALQSASDGYRGKTADGTAVALSVVREACSDGMSDARYPATAVLAVGDRSYRGCGRFLEE